MRSSQFLRTAIVRKSRLRSGNKSLQLCRKQIAKTVNGAVTSYIYDASMEDALAFDDILLEFDAAASPILTRRWGAGGAFDGLRRWGGLRERRRRT